MRHLSLLVMSLSLVIGVTLSGVMSPAADPYANFIAQTGPRSPAEEQKSFHLPPGFVIELVAAEPDIGKPINIAFDDRGRLWVTQSREYPFPAPETRKGRDAVRILEDTDGDGRADRFTTFADGLNIPIGLLPVRHGALVYSIPNIYQMLDTNGDDVADERKLLYGSIGHRDTHGMTSAFTWGFDGWVYACHGYSNTSTLRAADGSSVTMNSGNTYRMRADGAHVEQFTHGQVNPFGLCFDPLGDLFSADCHTKPVMLLLRGGWYQSFGKPHDGLGFAPEMCDHDHGSTAIAGIVYYAADQFPREHHGNLYVGNVVTNRINRDKLEWHGSSPRAIEQPDFLVSDDPWFRPVDLKLGPDGAMYVADFYNRIIGHYEVPLDHPGRDRERGRIWRISYQGPDAHVKAVAPRADWNKASVAELVQDLAHANLVVRTKATNQLVERGPAETVPAVQALLRPESVPSQRMHGLWVLERLHALDDGRLESAIADRESGVRVHAFRILGERRDLTEPFVKLVRAGLKDPDPFVRRAAAEALGTHPSPENLRPLLDLRHAVAADDTHLLHVVRMALRDQLRPAPTWARLQSGSWSDADRRAIADVATGVPSAEAAAFLLEHVQHLAETPDNLLRYVHHVARFGTDETRGPLLAFIRRQQPHDLKYQVALLTEIERGTQERGGKLSPPARQWGGELARKLVASPQADLAQAGVGLVQSLHLTELSPALSAMVAKKGLPEAQRAAAVGALTALDPKESVAVFGQLLGDASEPIALREQFANALAKINQPEARAELVRQLPTAPARLATVIAVGLAGSPQGAEQLFEAVAAGKASARLLQERAVTVRLEATKVPQLPERLAKLTQGLPPADQKLQELLKRRRAGFVATRKDAEAGLKVYEKHCAICHQLGGKGAKVGPQLDGVGNRGLDRILEDIIDPNRNVDQAFRSTALVLKNGQLVSGLLLREEGEVLVMADAQGKEVRVPKNTVEERSVSPLSPMPANLVDQIPEADFYALLAYLLVQRPSPMTSVPR